MNEPRDVFGVELAIGDFVVYADSRIGGDEIGLDFYQIVDIADGVVRGLLSSGEYMGNTFYLEDTHLRVARIRNPYNAVRLHYDQVLN